MADIKLLPLPPKQAISYFRSKGFKIGFDYRDVEAQEHNAAFTVAKAMTVDLLQDIRNACDDALAEGQSLGQFSKDLIPTLINKGWWGRQAMTDPLTGETVDAQLGSARRLDTIYTTNMRRAYAEGQWDRVQDTKADLPYLQYHGGLSHHPRAEHLKWNGLVLPADDPWWLAHYPPKEYGCKCLVTQLSAEQVASRGLKPGKAPAERMIEYVNKRTGEVQDVPAGVDPSFNYPMGQGRQRLNQVLVQKLNVTTPDIARNTVAGIVESPEFQSWYKALDPQPSANKPFMQQYPVAVIDVAAMESIGAKIQTLVLSDSTAVKQKLHHGDIDATEYRHVQTVIDQGQRFQDSDQSLVFALNEPDGFIAVVKTTKTKDELFLTSYVRMSRDEVDRDKVLRRLMRKEKKHKE